MFKFTAMFTVIVVAIYISIFTAVLLTDQLNSPPSQIQNPNPTLAALNLTQALFDLQRLTAHGPHPYNSHSNDLARSYILSRLRPIAAAHAHVHIADDCVSNGSWVNAGGPTGVYFEGTNVLVKVDGLEDAKVGAGGVLFSAHYDSVSTAPGATDDGMGVATLLQLVQLLAENRGRRTAVFNINNGEEDFLNGAHAFLEHPWSNITDTFLNLEGAASGGRPLVFRSSSLPPLRSFLPKHVPHPHLNVLSADAFARGAIRSDTDYSIYTGLHARTSPICPRNTTSCTSSSPTPKLMQGLDYAFYKRRSLYHTKYDAVPYTEGGRRALWSMMEGAAGAGRALVDVPFSAPALSVADTNKGSGAVYFDLFAATLIIFPTHALRTFNIVFLTLAPILAILLPLSLKRIRRIPVPPREPPSPPQLEPQEHPEPEVPRVTPRLQYIWFYLKSINWTPPWTRFWGALVLTIATQAALVLGYTKLNPYIIHSAPTLVLATSFALAYLTLTLPLTPTFPHISKSKPNATTPHRLQILTHLRTLLYLLLLLSTIFLPPDVGGTYFISTLAGCVFFGWLVGWVECLVREMVWRKRESGGGGDAEGEGEGREEQATQEEEEQVGARLDVDESGSAPWRSASEDRRNGAELIEPEPTETTPLLVQRRDGDSNGDGRWSKGGGEQGQFEEDADTLYTMVWCIVELLLVLPFPVILLSHILVMLIDGMGQSVIDGGSVWIAYTLPFALTTLLLLPLAPFTHKLHRGMTYLSFIVFVLGLGYTWAWAFPFSVQAPLKVYFQQSVELVGAGVKATTHLTGVPYYLERLVVPALPSAAGMEVRCGERMERQGLLTCVWESGGEVLPEPGFWKADSDSDLELLHSTWDSELKKNTTEGMTIPRNPWISGSVTRTSPSSLRFVLQGRNTRNCRIFLDSQRAAGYAVRPGAGGMQGGYEVSEAGVGEVRLWSRTWGREWVVDVEFFSSESGGVRGRVGCEWAEYESASVGVYVGKGRSGRIPALEEVLGFLPRWAAVTKAGDGLVEVWSAFEV